MKKYLITILLFAVTLNAGATDTERNNYDDIDGYFKAAERSDSPNINYFYISKAMLTMAGNNAYSGSDVNLKTFTNKIDFMRSVEVVSNKSDNDRLFLKNAERLATDVYAEYDYQNLLTTSKEGLRSHLFYKYGEGGLCSVLVVTTQKKIHPETGKVELSYARVLLIGGTFRAEDIPTLINF